MFTNNFNQTCHMFKHKKTKTLSEKTKYHNMYIRYSMCVLRLGIAQHGEPISMVCQRADFIQIKLPKFIYCIS